MEHKDSIVFGPYFRVVFKLFPISEFASQTIGRDGRFCFGWWRARGAVWAYCCRLGVAARSGRNAWFGGRRGHRLRAAPFCPTQHFLPICWCDHETITDRIGRIARDSHGADRRLGYDRLALCDCCGDWVEGTAACSRRNTRLRLPVPFCFPGGSGQKETCLRMAGRGAGKKERTIEKR
ncbi:AaceriAGL037Wp [[Ashbya] aceris (nom. inval.)]|nr:AaceriAGL037Wp [[Ashbya] aceris (nom. inval.)]